MGNICNELRTLVSKVYDAEKDWEPVSELIVYSTRTSDEYAWQVFKFHKAVFFNGYKLQVMILSKRVYKEDGTLLYVKDLFAEQWV